jgi:hypothetical protein
MPPQTTTTDEFPASGSPLSVEHQSPVQACIVADEGGEQGCEHVVGDAGTVGTVLLMRSVTLFKQPTQNLPVLVNTVVDLSTSVVANHGTGHGLPSRLPKLYHVTSPPMPSTRSRQHCHHCATHMGHRDVMISPSLAETVR